ncbi:hypothetical protein GVN16_19300 [Emticicia sp. CRIBPO]|uniref:hypothetical protein n=1 Tax=Emticicia sp. CRIBPO TaxID=2683258 RepID=UPI0014130F56|nr:hypothetical protein [Emticicia sp. CRIBPO]NBA87925.1 hypothetical protein [Emticicia sp. CRIBPO]
MINSIKSDKNLKLDHPILKGLQADYWGDWEGAHNIAQSKEGHPDYDRLHAYLHRKEGDAFNARYWYSRCKLPVPKESLEEEWEQLVLKYAQK